MSIKADPTEFAGKRVLVSGGTKGLGRATVERFLAGGARVITAARMIKDPIEGVEYVQA
ncbi:MAG TPA: short-chain dehydrogenase, partial [Sphingomicrobium sp.]